MSTEEETNRLQALNKRWINAAKKFKWKGSPVQVLGDKEYQRLVFTKQKPKQENPTPQNESKELPSVILTEQSSVPEKGYVEEVKKEQKQPETVVTSDFITAQEDVGEPDSKRVRVEDEGPYPREDDDGPIELNKDFWDIFE